jgi:uncharacterized protein (DUF111 family)
MALSNRQKVLLHRELSQIQLEQDQVVVRIDRHADALRIAQARVDEIERILAADVAVEKPRADLDEV